MYFVKVIPTQIRVVSFSHETQESDGEVEDLL